MIYNKNMWRSIYIASYQAYLNLLGISEFKKSREHTIYLSLSLEIFHLDISSKDDNDLQSENKWLISVTLFIFHLKISGKDDNVSQL